MKKRMKALLCATAIALSCGSTAQARQTVPSVADEIRAALAEQQVANSAGLDAEQLAERFYLPDVVIIGEGESVPRRGMDAAVEALRAWNAYLGPGGQKGCAFTMQEPVVASGDTASNFAVLACKANPPSMPADETIRQLFVWKRTPQGWRVALEMWQSGGFGK